MGVTSAMTEQQKKVLIIEDDPDDLAIISSILEENNFECNAVYSPTTALAMALTWKPDLILLDLIFPMMSGFACLRELKKNPQAARIPIVVLTGVQDDVIASSTIKLGASGYLNKDAMNRDLVPIVTKYAL